MCGLNPRLRAADAGVGFVTPGNRFWPAALAAGLVTATAIPSTRCAAHGIGMTDLVKRATARADELTRDEYRDGLARVERLVALAPTAARCASSGWPAGAPRSTGRRDPGGSPTAFGGRPAYVMPSTSGLNARARHPPTLGRPPPRRRADAVA